MEKPNDAALPRVPADARGGDGVRDDIAAAQRAYDAAAPAPPAPPRLDARDDADGTSCEQGGCDAFSASARGASARAQDARRAVASGGRLPAVSRALVAACAAIAVVAVAGVAAWTAYSGSSSPDGQGSARPQPAQTSAREDDAKASDVGEDADAGIVAERMQAQLDALASDEDGAFTGFVEKFVETYDRGVDTSLSYTLSDIEVSAADISERLLPGFSCRITDVDIHGATAWVSIEATSKSLSDAIEAFSSFIEARAGMAADEASYRSILKACYLEALDGVSPRTQTALVTVSQSDDGWVISDDAIEGMLGDIWYASS